MLKHELEKRVIYLSGYLNGLQDLDGGIREFFADAFLLGTKNSDAVRVLQELYSEHKNVSFQEPISVDDWSGFLERDLSEIILSRPFGVESIATSQVIERREYCTFRIMDQISFIIDDKFKGSSFFKVNALIKQDGMCTSVSFYMIHLSDISHYLILRFCASL